MKIRIFCLLLLANGLLLSADEDSRRKIESVIEAARDGHVEDVRDGLLILKQRKIDLDSHRIGILKETFLAQTLREKGYDISATQKNKQRIISMIAYASDFTEKDSAGNTPKDYFGICPHWIKGIVRGVEKQKQHEKEKQAHFIEGLKNQGKPR